MSGCAFDLAHYAELLDAAAAGGYRYATFTAEPEAGDLLLRQHQLFHPLPLHIIGQLPLHSTHRRAGLLAVGEHPHHVEAEVLHK